MTSIPQPDRTKMPPLGKNQVFHLNEPDTITLSNNIETSIIRAGTENITRIDMVFKAGSACQNKRLVASTTNNLLKEGTSQKSSSAIAGILDYYGAYLHTQINKDTASVTLYALSKHLNELLPLMAELISDSVFPENELNLYLQRHKQEYLVNIKKVRYLASLEFNKMVFGKNSAYGQVLTQNDFDNISREDVLTFYKNYYNPANAYIIISGFTDDNIMSLTEKHLGTLVPDKNMRFNNNIIYSENSAPQNKYIEQKEALQSALRIGKQIIGRNHPDFPAIQLLNTILGGYFGSRLMSNLREDKGYTYGISSFIQSYKHASAFTIATEVNADNTTEAVDEICKEISLLRKYEVDNKELQLVKNYVFGNFLKSFDGPLALAERYRIVKDAGLDFSYYSQSLQSMMKLSAKQLLETAYKYFEPESLLHLVVGKKK
jgi:predicted Zn-dependent peptidase